MSPTDTDKLVEVQEQMQKLRMSQMEQQILLFDRMERKDNSQQCSVKFPRLELNMFYGNKFQWFECWDAFISAVYTNTKLSDIETFNYLHIKFGGDAERALAGFALTNQN